MKELKLFILLAELVYWASLYWVQIFPTLYLKPSVIIEFTN